MQPWLLFVLLIVVILIIIWILITGSPESPSSPAAKTPVVDDQVVFDEENSDESYPPALSLHEPPPADDLTLIEGIGPKISAVLAKAGVLTFAQLAECKVDYLQSLLKDAGMRLGDPSTWAEQAGLAAAGDWEGLSAFQDDLKGGKRVDADLH